MCISSVFISSNPFVLWFIKPLDLGLKLLAERGGFEPPIPFQVYRFSRAAPSATQTPLQVKRPKLAICLDFGKKSVRRRFGYDSQIFFLQPSAAHSILDVLRSFIFSKSMICFEEFPPRPYHRPSSSSTERIDLAISNTSPWVADLPSMAITTRWL